MSCDQKQLFYRSNQSERVGSDTVTKFESITEIAPKSVSLRGYDYLNAGVLQVNRTLLKKTLGKFINTLEVLLTESFLKERVKKRWSNLDSNRKSTEAKVMFFLAGWIFFFASGVQE